MRAKKFQDDRNKSQKGQNWLKSEFRSIKLIEIRAK